MGELAARLARILTVVLVFGTVSSVYASDLPPTQEAVILTRALAYDRNLEKRAGDQLVLLVLVNGEDENSVESGRRIHRGFRKLQRHRVQGLPFHAVLTSYTNAEELEGLVEEHDIDALYVSRGLEHVLDEIQRISRAHDATTMGARSSFVRNGLCLSVSVHDNRPRILLNRNAERAEGAAFGAGLLRLAKIIR